MDISEINTKQHKIPTPECFTPEENMSYPLCIGKDKNCIYCNLFKDFEGEEYP